MTAVMELVGHFVFLALDQDAGVRAVRDHVVVGLAIALTCRVVTAVARGALHARIAAFRGPGSLLADRWLSGVLGAVMPWRAQCALHRTGL